MIRIFTTTFTAAKSLYQTAGLKLKNPIHTRAHARTNKKTQTKTFVTYHSAMSKKDNGYTQSSFFLSSLPVANVGNTISRGGLNLFHSLTSLQEYGKFL